MSAPTFDAPMLLGAQIDARAAHPALADRPFLVQEDRSWTYREFRDRSVRTAHFLRGRIEPASDECPGHVAILLDNHFELLSLLGGCGYAGYTLFGINTGLRGDTLAGVIDHSRAPVLVVDDRLWPEVERVREGLAHVRPENLIRRSELEAQVDAETAGEAFASPPEVEVDTDRNLMVIYTSGTTGLPKGINNSHGKLCLSGAGIAGRLGLGPDDRGYACMPLFHSNAMFMAFMGSLWAGASLLVRERFSASQFLPDVLRYGVTYWNYVGEPVHYVLSAIEQACEGDPERIRKEVTQEPRNKLRAAIGNGASPPDMDRAVDWLGLDDIFELYGSTEAAVSTFRQRGDPRGSTGEIIDPNVKILREDGSECAPAVLDETGRLVNAAEAIGEICRVAPDPGLFQGYFDNRSANEAKFRDGVFYTGDLGHVLVQPDGRRFLFFDGRTDDWIRKDGENFSAAQVSRLLAEHPHVSLAAAYGVPCAVSDELVMAAIELRPGASFDGAAFYAFCNDQVEAGSMDRKWVPDFVRVVEAFEYTTTQKILVRNLKRVHFSREHLPEEPIFWRERGDDAFRAFTRDDWLALRSRFEAAEKLELLERG